MRKKIYDKRWFILTIALILFTGFSFWGVIEITIAKMDTRVIESNNAFLTLKIRNLAESDDILDIIFEE